MTVQNTTNKFTLDGDGVTTIFPYSNIKLIETSDMQVYLIDSLGDATLQTEGVDYSITYDDDTESGDVTMFVAPAADEKVNGIRARPLDQPFDIPLDSDFDAEKMEKMNDNVVVMVQDQQDQLNRSLKAPQTFTGDFVSEIVAQDQVVVGNDTGDGFKDSGVNIATLNGDLSDAVAAAEAAQAGAEAAEANASVSETNAATSASNAATSETNAATSETNAAASAAAALVSEGNAATSETNAAASALEAANSAESIGFKWAFDSTTTMADPTSGNFRLNNADPTLVTAVAIADNSADTGTPDVSDYVLSWDDSTNAASKGYLILREISSPENFVTYKISGTSTDNTGWTQLVVTYNASSGTFTNTNDIMISFSASGDSTSVAVDDVTIEDTGSFIQVKDNGITLAKMASGTAGNLITYDASGDPAVVATGTSGQVLTSNGAGAAPTMQDPAGGSRSIFFAEAPHNTSFGGPSPMKVPFSTVLEDDDSIYDAPLRRVTAPSSGKVYINTIVSISESSAHARAMYCQIRKNGTEYVNVYGAQNLDTGTSDWVTVSYGFEESCVNGDYYEVWFRVGGGSPSIVNSSLSSTIFNGSFIAD